ncbi:hypothetical protein [Spirulina sp. 06S082]|uniref:hypothetical protein n=1 Tax=Spirulina sp. 06S082 TaxID=3110248 RepID=UPI002B20C81E|nr:hypothetical protein [Spirulina sp. 06S082]MEA5470263.1 hypothetical protein [Spirulina sp. 06S082]
MLFFSKARSHFPQSLSNISAIAFPLVFKNRDRQNIKEQIKDKSVITLSFLSSHRRGLKIPVSYKKSIEMDYSFIVDLSSIDAFFWEARSRFPQFLSNISAIAPLPNPF